MIGFSCRNALIFAETILYLASLPTRIVVPTVIAVLHTPYKMYDSMRLLSSAKVLLEKGKLFCQFGKEAVIFEAIFKDF